MAFALEPAGMELAPELARIHRESFEKHWNAKDFEELLASGGTHALVAGVVGMIVWRVMHEQSEILTTAVVPASRRQGIGRRLLAEAMAQAHRAGATRMFLEVDAGNAAAQKLYEAQKFTVSGRRKAYYRQPDGSFTDALVMSCELA